MYWLIDLSKGSLQSRDYTMGSKKLAVTHKISGQYVKFSLYNNRARA